MKVTAIPAVAVDDGYRRAGPDETPTHFEAYDERHPDDPILLGTYSTLDALRRAHPDAIVGDY